MTVIEKHSKWDDIQFGSWCGSMLMFIGYMATAELTNSKGIVFWILGGVFAGLFVVAIAALLFSGFMSFREVDKPEESENDRLDKQADKLFKKLKAGL